MEIKAYGKINLSLDVTGVLDNGYHSVAMVMQSVELCDKVYIEKILPGKMYYNLKDIEQFGFWRDIKVLFMTVFAVLGKEYRGDYADTQEKEEVEV